MTGGFKRKQNFVDKGVQGGLIRRIFVHWVVFFFVTTLAVLSLKTLLGEPSLSFSDRLSAELGEFVYLGIVFLAIFPAFMLDTIRFSNRFVGPITRLRRHIRELSQGETENIKFRDNDFWLTLADEFNELNDLVKSQKKEIEDLKQALNQPLKEDSCRLIEIKLTIIDIRC